MPYYNVKYSRNGIKNTLYFDYINANNPEQAKRISEVMHKGAKAYSARLLKK